MSASLEPLRLDDQLCFALHAAARATTAAYAPLLTELGITYPQYLVMLVLWEEDGARVTRLAERLQLEPATLTPLLKRLESRGLVTRERSPDDERVVEVFLTTDGKRLKRRALEVPITLVRKSNLTLAEIARLRETLKVLVDALRTDDAGR